MSDDVTARAKKIKMILMDVDGVMTDGKIFYGNDGFEAKQFDAKDGVGIRIAQRLGIKFGLITGRNSESVIRRAAELEIKEVHQGQKRKIEPYEDILARHALKDDEVCFIGDDVVDLPVMRRVGFPVAVADSHPDILPFAVHTTICRGGEGAIREVIDLIMKAQGKWDDMMKRYL